MHRYSFLAFVLLLNPLFLLAQSATNWPDKPEHTALLEGKVNIYSNALNQDFIQALYLGDYLNADIKEGVDLQSRNYLFAETRMGLGIEVKTRLKEGSRFRNIFGMRIFNQRFIHANFNADSYQLLFFGNTLFQSEDAYLNKLEYNDMHYSGLQLFYGKEWINGQHRHTLLSRPSLLIGHSYQRLFFDSGKLYTALFGEFLNLEANYTYQEVNPNNTFSINGLGAGIDLIYQYKNDEQDWSISAGLEDLGMIRWMNQAESVSKDTSLWLQGAVSDLFPEFNFENGDDFIYSELSRDLYYDALQDDQFYSLTPARIHLQFHKKWFDQELETGFHYTHLLIDPTVFMIQANVRYQIMPFWKLGLEPGLLAGNRFYFQISSDFKIWNELALRLHYGDFNTFIQPANSYTQQARVALHFSW